MPELIFKFAVPSEHYEADVCIVWCFDCRFDKRHGVADFQNSLLQKFIDYRGFRWIDYVTEPGGAKFLASNGRSDPDFTERRSLLWRIEKSVELHKTGLLVLMVHADCAAYGGSKTFGGDKSAEYVRLGEDLNKAEAFLRMNFGGGIAIEKYIADFDGLRRV